jgi:hypothetical protein
MVRRFFRSPIPTLLLIMGVFTAHAFATVVRADDLDPDQIKFVLHATTDIEGGFIDRTVGMVQAGKLPRDMFTSCYIWARKKPRHQFQYFQKALTVRAAAIGITL